MADDGLVGDASLRWAKGSTWVLDTNQGRVVGAKYLAPLRLKDLAGHYQGSPVPRAPASSGWSPRYWQVYRVFLR